jgi:hypothetical protein
MTVTRAATLAASREVHRDPSRLVALAVIDGKN